MTEEPSRVEFRVTFDDLRTKGQSAPGVRLTETIRVEPAGVTVSDEVADDSVTSLRICYPMLVFDGLQKTEIELTGNKLKLRLDGRGVQFELLQPAGAILRRSGTELKHRNGMVEPVYADVRGRMAVYRIGRRTHEEREEPSHKSK